MVYPNSPAFNAVKELRDRAIAILRFKKINAFVEKWQAQYKEVMLTKRAIEKTQVSIERISQEEFSLTASQVADGLNIEMIKAAKLEDLNQNLSSLKTILESREDVLKEYEKNIEDIRQGKFKFDRENITKKAEELLESGRFEFDQTIFLVNKEETEDEPKEEVEETQD